MTTAGGPPDAALRVPLPGGGPTSGSWGAVRFAAGVPVLLADPDRYLARADLAWTTGVAPERDEDLTATLAAMGYETLCFLARYLPALVTDATPLRQAVARLLAAYAPPGAELAVEAGCAVGADLRTLRRFADRVVGFDTNLGALVVAKRQLAGATIPHLVRREGRIFDRARDVALPAVAGVTVLVGDAHDPPLRGASADIVLALNVLDNVRDPLLVLGQLDAVLRPGGLIIVGSPFAWNDAITAPEAQLGGTHLPPFAGLDSPTVLADILTGQAAVVPALAYELLEREEVPWEVVDHARCTVRFAVHLLAARKRGG
jgi:SAM-dependent methyltransferase